MPEHKCTTCQAMRDRLMAELKSGNLTGAAKTAAIGALLIMGVKWDE